MKVLNIVRYLPIKGFPAENDITLKIYADLKKQYGVDSLFVMPVAHIPKLATHINKSSKRNFKIINNNNYKDKDHLINIRFFQSLFPFSVYYNLPNLSYYSLVLQFDFYKKRLYNIFKKFKPDIIHAHTIRDAYYAYRASKKFKTPYIITLRGKNWDIYKLSIVKKILNNAKYLITPSYTLYELLKKDYPIKLLPHGIDKFWYNNESKVFDKSIIRLVTTSRLLEMKNIQVVIKSIAILKKEGYNIKYSIIGEGAYKVELEKLVKQLGLVDEVKFYGFRSHDEIKRIYKNNDIFIMLSTPETFGRVYFEAAAQGLLIVGVKNTGAHGYFDDDEGFFINPIVEDAVKTIKMIDNINFSYITNRSQNNVASFQNEFVIKEYYNILRANTI